MDVPLRKAKKSLDWVVSGPRFALDNPTKKCNNQGNDASDQVLRLLLRWGDGYLQQLPDLQFPVRIECELAIIHYGQVSFGQIGGFSNLHTKNGGSIPFRGLIHLCLNGVAAAFDALGNFNDRMLRHPYHLRLTSAFFHAFHNEKALMSDQG